MSLRTIGVSQLAEAMLASSPPPREALDVLHAAGFRDAAGAWRRLRRVLAQEEHGLPSPAFAPRLLEELAASFDPNRALNNLERFIAGGPDRASLFTLLNDNPETLRALVAIFSGSQYLSDILISDPSLLDWLSGEEALAQPRFKDEMQAALRALIDAAPTYGACLAQVRRFKKREVLRIGLRDLLLQAELAETLEDLSNLAEVCVELALELTHRDLVARYGQPMIIAAAPDDAESVGVGPPPARPCEFVVLGLGKLGGRELNVSSDIDLMYLYTSSQGSTSGIPGPDGQPLQQLSNHEFYVKLAQRLTSALHEITSEGHVYRVDLNLRPDGSRGELVNSLRSCEIYYESWGETWERQAMMKARPIAGSAALGQQFADLMRPFIYRRHLDFSALEEIRAMKQRIDDHIARRLTAQRDIKLGRGGIREIEFIVQAFQLIYGGRDPWLRERNTLRALHRLASKELLSYEEYARLTRAYIFLRDLENRIQLMYGRQTHSIPDEPAELRALAAKMGFAEAPDPAAALLQCYEEHAASVRAVFDDLLRRPEEAEEPAEVAGLSLEPEEAERDREFLERRGFRDGARVLRDLLLLRDGLPYAHPSARSRRSFMRLLPTVVAEAARTPEPALAIANLVKFVEAHAAREALYTLFLDEPRLLETLLQLCGTSRFLAASLVRFPDVTHGLVDPAALRLAGEREAMRAELRQATAAQRHHDERLDSLRRFKQAEELRIGIRAVGGDLDDLETSRALSALADAFLEGVLELEQEVARSEMGRPICAPGGAVGSPGAAQGAERECGFCIVALGKLGGSELSFGSDLDLFFVYDDDGVALGGAPGAEVTNQQYFAKLAARIIHSVSSFGRSGFAYRLDSRLRPDGKSGILANSLPGLARYVTSRAQTWERQALTKARVVAGDVLLATRLMTCVEQFVYETPFSAATAQAIEAMRQRLERELAGEREAWRSLKFARGSLLSIEFLIQALQLKEGGRRRSLRVPGTAAALEALASTEVLSPERLRRLSEAFRFYKRLEMQMRIVDDRPHSRLPSDPERLAVLARAVRRFDAEVTGAASLVRRYRALQEGIAEVYDAVMGELGAAP
ncbi:MAG: glutamate-ammonia-ligase adenylyltransferase [Candidatus Tectomicrobia bacterium]|nr:glutamate-ammonia-ligase adenylyltransferase [Candidatus Tectomicrobia bacterium]